MEETRRQAPSHLSLFTGAGGLDLGLEAVGFEHLGWVEADPYARETLLSNRPEWNRLQPDDVVEFAASLADSNPSIRPGSVDLISAGPPCQPYSTAGQWTASGRNGLSDRKHYEAFDRFIDVVKHLQPRAVLIENVPGFVSGPASGLGHLMERLGGYAQGDSPYNVDHRILDAADYGVPQRRRRAFVVVAKNGVGFEWPEPSHEDDPVTAYEGLSGVQSETYRSPTGKWADLLASIPEGHNYQWHTEKGDGLPLFGYRTRYWSFLLKLARDRPSWTISASPGPATGPFHWENRPLSVEETMRLQSFPTTWRLSGPERSRIRQAGNATPPLLAEVIGRSLYEALTGRAVRGDPKLALRRKPVPQTPSAVAPVPEKYLSLVGAHQAHPGPGNGPSPRPSISPPDR